MNDQFLQSIKHIDNIVFDKSISIFHDINALFIILYEKYDVSKSIQTSKNITKKVFISSNANKNTRRKQFKAINTT